MGFGGLGFRVWGLGFKIQAFVDTRAGFMYPIVGHLGAGDDTVDIGKYRIVRYSTCAFLRLNIGLGTRIWVRANQRICSK